MAEGVESDPKEQGGGGGVEMETEAVYRGWGNYHLKYHKGGA